MSARSFATDGFVLVPDVMLPHECAALAEHLRPAAAASGGTRKLLAQPWCAALAERLRAHPALAPYLAPDCVVVQCTYFEKSATRNWLVPLHQDLSIPVAARVESAQLRGWSLKEGVNFVQAPPAVLQSLVAVRLHIDACEPDDGPLRVVPGSHLHGVITDDAATGLRDAGQVVDCCAAAGTALVMRPLLLHASSKSRGSSQRRVLHFVFGPPVLPFELAWNSAIHVVE